MTCICNSRHHRFAVFSSRWEQQGEGENHWSTLLFDVERLAIGYANSFASHSAPAVINRFCGFCRSLGKRGIQ